MNEVRTAPRHSCARRWKACNGIGGAKRSMLPTNHLPAASIDNVISTVDVEGIAGNELGTIHCENSHSDANIID